MSEQTNITPEKTISQARPRGGQLSRATRWLDRLWVYLASDTIPVMAAALAYRTIFSLIPLLGIGLLVLRLFGDSEAIVKRVLTQILDLSGLSQLIQANDDGKFRLDAWIEQSVSGLGKFSFTGLGIVSALALIYAAMGLLVEVEKSFNAIFGVEKGRSWGGRIMRYWLAISLGPLLVVASFLVGERASAIARDVAGSGGVMGPTLVELSGYLVSVGISGTLLTVLYLAVPNTRVRFKAAIAGGLSAAVFLELAKYGFGLFVSGAGYSSIYGQLALLPLFMLWIYTTWFIVLLGLRVSYLMQHRNSSLLMIAARLGGGAPSDGVCIEPASAVAVLSMIAKRFERGLGAISGERIGAELSLDTVFVQRVLTLAAARGMVALVNADQNASRATSGGGENYVLARPAATIMMRDVLSIGFELAQVPSGAEAAAVVRGLRKEQLEALGERALGAEASGPGLKPQSADGPGQAVGAVA